MVTQSRALSVTSWFLSSPRVSNIPRDTGICIVLVPHPKLQCFFPTIAPLRPQPLGLHNRTKRVATPSRSTYKFSRPDSPIPQTGTTRVITPSASHPPRLALRDTWGAPVSHHSFVSNHVSFPHTSLHPWIQAPCTYSRGTLHRRQVFPLPNRPGAPSDLCASSACASIASLNTSNPLIPRISRCAAEDTNARCTAPTRIPSSVHAAGACEEGLAALKCGGAFVPLVSNHIGSTILEGKDGVARPRVWLFGVQLGSESLNGGVV